MALDARQSATRAAEMAASSLRLAERPVLSVGSWGISNFGVNGPFSMTFKITNSGRSHAEAIETRTGYAVSPEGSVPDEMPPLKSNEQIGPGLLGPSDKIEVEVMSDRAVTGQEYQEVVSQQKFIFCYGEVLFKDAFGWRCRLRYGAQLRIDLNVNESFPTFIKKPAYNSIEWLAPQSS